MKQADLPAEVFRLGRRPDPWAWPDWAFAEADGTFGNRYDDPQGIYRVLYASTQRVATFVECLAGQLRDLGHRTGGAEPATGTGEGRPARRLGKGTVERGQGPSTASNSRS